MNISVCVLSQFYYPVRGGMSRYAYDLSRGLAGQGVDVHVVTLRPLNRPEFEEIDGVKVHRVGGHKEAYFVLGLPLMARKAMELCREQHVDVVHGQIPHVSDVSLPKSGIKALFVETIHVPLDVETASLRLEKFGDLLSWEKFVVMFFPLSRIFERHVINRADGLIGVSQSTKRDAINSYGISQDRIKVVYEGIFSERFMAEREGWMVRKRYKLGESPVILYVGRHCARKRLELLLYATHALRKVHGDVKLIIVGRKTKYTDRLISIVGDLKIGDSVIFTDYVTEEELPRYYAACDVFALTSQQESLGLTVLEAMASGKPVVVPNVGGLPEVVEHGKTGLLFDMFEELVDDISAIISDKKLARSMGRAGKKRLLEMFTCQTMARNTLQFYEGLLSKY